MKSYFLLSSVLLLFASCNSDGNNKATNAANKATHPNQNNEATSGLPGCYLRVLKRDTLALSIQQNGKTITGRLSFKNFEKDGSTGTVTGAIDEDILKLIYSFQSEGMHSVMEVYFKIEGNALIHGVGEVAVKSDTAYYANPKEITYPAANMLVKISCDQLASKYK